jgi:multiple sugar transport system substrate-binding protein
MQKWREILLVLLVSTGLTALSGCRQQAKAPPTSVPSFPGLTLRIGALENTAILAGVTAQRGEWVASRGGKISIHEPPLSVQSVGEVDILLFPADRLGELVDANALAKIPNEMVMPPKPAESGDGSGDPDRSSGEPKPEDTFLYMDIAPAYRDQVTRYGNDRLALPCGGSALVLIYRRDAFERDANVAAAKEKGLKLQAPRTWNELDALARFFQGRDWDGDGSPDHGITLVLGADAEGLGNATFLARAASLGQHPDHFSFLFDSERMTPRIDTDPFVEALQSTIALKASGPPGMETFDADAARASFRTGTVAMLIDRAERFSTWSHGKRAGVAPLPGSERVFDPSAKTWVSPPSRNAPSYLPHGGGWLIGVRRGLSGTQHDAAIDLVKYLAGPECSRSIRAERTFSMLPFRISQMSQGLPDPTSAPDVDTRLWSDAVSRTLLSDRVVPGLRIPGAAGYLDDLAKGRHAALAGEDARKALEGVARAWAERTKAKGPKRQLWHYRRSLNLRATTPEPPEPGT